MEQSKQEIFDELIVATKKLVTVVDNAAVTLSEEFEDMVTGPQRAVEAVLDKCPQPTTVWDGSVREEDLDVEYYEPDAPAAGSDLNRGVKITHKITGIGRESHSKPYQGQNHAIALESLTEAVREEFARMGQ